MINSEMCKMFIVVLEFLCRLCNISLVAARMVFLNSEVYEIWVS